MSWICRLGPALGLSRRGKLQISAGGTWEVISGPFHKGYLPAGRYTINNAVGVDDFRCKIGKGFGWWCPIKPQFMTTRESLGIHPDGNKPGTEGCIGITSGDTNALYYKLKASKGQTLVVEYSS